MIRMIILIQIDFSDSNYSDNSPDSDFFNNWWFEESNESELDYSVHLNSYDFWSNIILTIVMILMIWNNLI